MNAKRKVEVIYSTGGSDIVHLIVNDTVFTVNQPKLDRIFSTVIGPCATPSPPLHRMGIRRSSRSFCFAYSMLSRLCI